MEKMEKEGIKNLKEDINVFEEILKNPALVNCGDYEREITLSNIKSDIKNIINRIKSL